MCAAISEVVLRLLSRAALQQAWWSQPLGPAALACITGCCPLRKPRAIWSSSTDREIHFCQSMPLAERRALSWSERFMAHFSFRFFGRRLGLTLGFNLP